MDEPQSLLDTSHYLGDVGLKNVRVDPSGL
jgi:hypothetical protein